MRRGYVNAKLIKYFGILAFFIGLICGCTEKANHTAAEAPINSTANVPTTNETVRVNQPRAYQRDEAISANGTNVQLREAAGAASSGADKALSERVKTTLQSDSTLSPLMEGIHISAKNGKVTIAGTVKTEAQKQRIFEMTREIVGADNLENKIEVKSTPEGTSGPEVQKNTQP
ncbi:MAG: hypothetical protein JWM68_4901 [Verrucomicrobiales bacterium]|nr:hypothetical protein [Verrucomicrobiales bacterium]